MPQIHNKKQTPLKTILAVIVMFLLEAYTENKVISFDKIILQRLRICETAFLWFELQNVFNVIFHLVGIIQA